MRPGTQRRARPAAGLLLAVVVGCAGANEGSEPAPPAAATASAPDSGSGGARLANPASTNCVERGGQLEMIEGPGGTAGVCRFADGSRCEEWRFFRGECAPGECREPSGLCE